MGVLRDCSCLITAERQADSGASTISEGKEAVLGVWRGGRTGLVAAEGILSVLSECDIRKGPLRRGSGDDARGGRSRAVRREKEQAVRGERASGGGAAQ
jgi:hypothetical protein